MRMPLVPGVGIGPLVGGDGLAKAPAVPAIISNVPGSFAWHVFHDRHPEPWGSAAIRGTRRRRWQYNADRQDWWRDREHAIRRFNVQQRVVWSLAHATSCRLRDTCPGWPPVATNSVPGRSPLTCRAATVW